MNRTLFFLGGLSHVQIGNKVSLDDGTINIYPDDEGYLVNYPGKKSYFWRHEEEQPPTGADSYGVAPDVGDGWTRVFSFKNFLGNTLLVLVVEDKLVYLTGLDYVVLHIFNGYSPDGFYYPSFFVSDGRLIISNPGDPVLQWDGVNSIRPLGVLETPTPPVVHGSIHPHIVGHSPEHYFPFKDATCWGPQLEPAELADGTSSGGPSWRTNSAGDNIPTEYSWVVQYSDEYGNKGRASSPSPLQNFQVPFGSEFTFDDIVHTLLWYYVYPLVLWQPPKHDNHIFGVTIGRTTNQNIDDAAYIGGPGVFYREEVRLDCIHHRFTSTSSDETITAGTLIDLDVEGPPSAIMGCHFAGRIWLLDSDRSLIHYSDLALTGQFRATNQIRPVSITVAMMPAGDRLFIIGHDSTQVYYEHPTLGPALFEEDLDNGSEHGNSFVKIGDGAVFGLWNKGFGYYDGREHKFVDVPFYISSLYLDNRGEVHRAVRAGDWYYLTIRKDYVTTNNNVIVMCHLPTNRWYVVEDDLNDIVKVGEEILGVSDDLYYIFRGDEYPEAKLRTTGFIPDGSHPTQQRTINDLRLMVYPTAFIDVDLVLEGESRNGLTSEQTVMIHPSDTKHKRGSHPLPYWGAPRREFSGDHEWTAPNDVWITPRGQRAITAFYHKIDISIPAGNPFRIKGFSVGIGTDTRTKE